VAPQSRKRKSSRNQSPFKVREILIYGSPLWIGAPVVGWYYDGLLGLKSALIGLLLLGVYIGSTIIAARESRRLSAKKTVAIAVAGFWIRLIGLWFLVFLLSRFVELNLLVLLITLAIGFTATVAISAKDWLQS